MFCSRRNVNMAWDVDFTPMSRNGHALPKIKIRRSEQTNVI